jgi:hypothetical protein
MLFIANILLIPGKKADAMGKVMQIKKCPGIPGHFFEELLIKLFIVAEF